MAPYQTAPIILSPISKMNELEAFLIRSGYVPRSLRLNSTGHLILRASHSGRSLSLVLDTGAGQSCLSQSVAEHMALSLEESDDIAAGIGGSLSEGCNNIAHTQLDLLRFGDFEINDMNFAVIDLSYINKAINNIGEADIDGIIGSDLLLKHDAVIDYTSKKLYIRLKTVKTNLS